jgi:hypothetical protein
MPLIIRRTAEHFAENKQPKPEWGPNDYLVFSGGFIVGSIRQETAGQQRGKWFWAINGVHAGPAVMAICSHTDTLEDAKAQLASEWRKWLAWSKLTEIE